jgi:hypothetical protein
MSTISFPSDSHFQPSSHPHSANNHPSFFPSSYDPDIPQSAFQVNPHSPHPPRTPKPSVHSSHPSVHHDEKSRFSQPDTSTKIEDDTDSLSSSDLTPRKPRVPAADVWRDILTTSSGRDKALVRRSRQTRVKHAYHYN